MDHPRLAESTELKPYTVVYLGADGAVTYVHIKDDRATDDLLNAAIGEQRGFVLAIFDGWHHNLISGLPVGRRRTDASESARESP